MSHSPYVAVVLEGGLVQTILIEAWPPALPLPRFIVVDYDTEGAGDDELTAFTIGTDHYEAVCHGVEPTVYESLETALSPRHLLTASSEQADDSAKPSALAIARDVYRSVRALDRELEDPERATAWEYHNMYLLAERGLRDILKALGDSTDFGT